MDRKLQDILKVEQELRKVGTCKSMSKIILFHQNIQSLSNKTDELSITLHNNDIDPHFICLSEHFLKESEIAQISLNTRSAGGVSLPESANSGQIDWRVLYCLLIYIMLSRAGKYLKTINCLKVVIYFIMFYTYDVSNRPIPGNITYNE
jgi:hypothetical protein